MLWVILVCMNCHVADAREQGWRAAPALERVDTAYAHWRQDDRRTFASRNECLRTLRRERPETDWTAPDNYGQINKTTHYPDYVETFESIPMHMNGTENFGCFSLEPPIG